MYSAGDRVVLVGLYLERGGNLSTTNANDNLRVAPEPAEPPDDLLYITI